MMAKASSSNFSYLSDELFKDSNYSLDHEHQRSTSFTHSRRANRAAFRILGRRPPETQEFRTVS